MRLPWQRRRPVGGSRWSPDVVEAMRGRGQFTVRTSPTQIACSLWEFGEDELADRALEMSEEDLAAVLRICAVYEDRSYPLPVEGVAISHGHVDALAVVAYVEGSLRPLRRTRRRPRTSRPERFTPQPLDPDVATRLDGYRPR